MFGKNHVLCVCLLPLFLFIFHFGEQSHFKPYSFAKFAYVFSFNQIEIRGISNFCLWREGFSQWNIYQNSRNRLIVSKWIIYRNRWSWLVIDQCGRKIEHMIWVNFAHFAHFTSISWNDRGHQNAFFRDQMSRLWPAKKEKMARSNPPTWKNICTIISLYSCFRIDFEVVHHFKLMNHFWIGDPFMNSFNDYEQLRDGWIDESTSSVTDS